MVLQVYVPRLGKPYTSIYLNLKTGLTTRKDIDMPKMTMKDTRKIEDPVKRKKAIRKLKVGYKTKSKRQPFKGRNHSYYQSELAQEKEDAMEILRPEVVAEQQSTLIAVNRATDPIQLKASSHVMYTCLRLDKITMVFKADNRKFARKLIKELEKYELSLKRGRNGRGKLGYRRHAESMYELYKHNFSLSIPGTRVYRERGTGPAYLNISYHPTDWKLKSRQRRGEIRIEFNPAHLGASGFEALTDILREMFGSNYMRIMRHSHITRVDVAIDIMSNYFFPKTGRFIVSNVRSFEGSAYDDDEFIERLGRRKWRDYEAYSKYPKWFREKLRANNIYPRRLEIECKPPKKKIYLRNLRDWLYEYMQTEIAKVTAVSIQNMPFDESIMQRLDRYVEMGETFQGALKRIAKQEVRNGRDRDVFDNFKKSLPTMQMPALDPDNIRYQLETMCELERLENTIKTYYERSKFKRGLRNPRMQGDDFWRIRCMLNGNDPNKVRSTVTEQEIMDYYHGRKRKK